MKRINFINKKISEQSGITLIALVITIIVLLILAGVTIATLTGDNGLLTKAGNAKDASIDGKIEEQIKLAYQEWQVAQYTGNIESIDNYIRNSLNVTYGDNAVSDVTKSGNVLMVTFSNEKIYIYNILKEKAIDVTNKTNIAKSDKKIDSFVGYYADIDLDGEVDGIIFADLLTGSIKNSQSWGAYNQGVYVIPKYITIGNLNEYYISQESYTDSYFGTHAVISPKTINKEERFYIMTLSNLMIPEKTDGTEEENHPAYTSYYWYKKAKTHMSPLITSNDFGQGKENTRLMIDKYNAAGTENGYTDSLQDNQDIWKNIQIKYDEGWFVPSRGEWAAFVNELNITKNNFQSYGLYKDNWTSSQRTNSNSWFVALEAGNVYGGVVDSLFCVRLATTF